QDADHRDRCGTSRTRRHRPRHGRGLRRSPSRARRSLSAASGPDGHCGDRRSRSYCFVMSNPTPPPVKKLTHHVFICTNERPPGHPRGSCKQKNSEQLIQIFKEEISKAGISANLRAQRAGCLDVCEFGPSVVVYPDGVWYGHVSAKDVAEIVREHLVHGK